MKIFILMALLFATKGVSSTVEISGLNYHFGSENGGVSIAVYGKNFEPESFDVSEANAHLGNTVFFYSDAQEYECIVDKVATDENTITCTTQPMREGVYYVRVKSNGEDIPSQSYCYGNPKAYACSLTIVWWRTPTLQSISPVTSLPGALVTYYGRLFTNRTQTADIANANNQASIVRVWIGGKKCDLYETPDVLYGVELLYNEATDTFSNWGSLKCMHTGSYVASQNASFIIGGDYGRSQPDPSLMMVSSEYKLYSFQTYAGIKEVSPITGSMNGGTLITVTGDYLDDNSIDVKVGGSSCQVVDRQDASLTCLTSPPDLLKYTDAFPGSRGLLVEIYPGMSDSSQITGLTFDEFTGTKLSLWLDRSEISLTAPSQPVLVRMQGFFVPAKSGTYTFSSTKPDSTTIYVSTNRAMANKVEASGPLSLDGELEYYIEVIHKEATTLVSFIVWVHLGETDYVSSQTATAKADTQEILVQSPSDSEIQTVRLNNWDETASPISQVFELCLSCSTPFDEYVISNNQVEVQLQCHYDPNLLKFWLGQLLSPEGETVTVEEFTDAACSFAGRRITVGSSRGRIPLAVRSIDEATTTVSLTVTTEPLASLTSFNLAINGVSSPNVEVGNTGSLESAVRSLFGVSCPTALGIYLGVAANFSDFESLTSSVHGGEITVEDSYCETSSLKNPENVEITLQSSIQITDHKLCFAYKGNVSFTLAISFLVSDLSTGKWSTYYKTYEGTENWTHTCLDVLAALRSIENGLEYLVTGLSIKPNASDNDFFIDNIFIGKIYMAMSDIEKLRGMRVEASSVKLQHVHVALVNEEYVIEMVPHNCEVNLPVLQAAYGTFDDTDTYTSSAAWGSASITIKRTQASSAPAGGTFDITLPVVGDEYGGTVRDIPWDVEAKALEQEIESIRGVNDVTVSREGTCRSRTWLIEFVSPGGVQKEFSVASNFENNAATIESKVITKGGLHINPIPGDWLRTAHKSPQVQVTINNVPSKCQDSCTFTPDASATPTLSDVSITGTTVTIEGDGFSSTAVTENTVEIGGVGCSVTSATGTNIVCTLGESPGGDQPVVVSVLGRGFAEAGKVLIPVAITGISPQIGSTKGGTVVTLTGTGFSDEVSVQVGESCEVITATYTTITCTTAAHAAGEGSILIDAEAAPGITYTFQEPTATGTVAPLTLTVLGGSLTIGGSGFGSDESKVTVFVGEEVASITSFSDTEIIAEAASMAPTTYAVRVHIAGFGDADLGDQSQVQYELQVTAVAPTSASTMGGVELEVSGNGFVEGVEVEVGGNACVVKDSTVTATSLTCTMAACGATHKVENTGTSADGYGYAWNPSKFTISVGDVVTWSWTQVTGVSGAAYQVFTTSSATSVEPDGNGFSSGAATGSGSFSYRFNIPGTYYYGGTGNSAKNIFMKGVIDVNTQDADRAAAVSVSVGGHQAVHSGGEKTVSCQETLTPKITSISHKSGTSNVLITITGSGFSDVAGETSVFVGDAECTVETVTAESVSCKVGTDTGLTVGLNQEVTVKVAGKGTSRTDIRNWTSRYFALLPHIASVTPSSGSLAGGTMITITGGGLSQATDVVGIDCAITSKSYTSVECVTGASAAATQDVKILVHENSHEMEAACSGTCTFEYSEDNTPLITDVQPATLTSATSVTITGSGLLGSGLGTSVLVGSYECPIAKVTDTEVNCDLDSLPLGDYSVKVNVEGKGSANSNSVRSVRSLLQVHSISKTSGSIKGGQEIEISGNGFVVDHTTVTIGDAECIVSDVVPNKVVCTTGASAAGTKDLVVTSNDESATSNDDYEYAEGSTPVVTSVDPDTGEPGQTISISVTGLGSDMPSVSFGGVSCGETSRADDTVACTLGSRYGGTADIIVNVPSKGNAVLDPGVSFTYLFGVESIEPEFGSLGGGQQLTVTGYGFSSETTVSICDNTCAVMAESVQATSITCVTPASTTATTCSVVAANSGAGSITKKDAFTYDATLTPQVTQVSPTNGGTGGGTILTISGSGLNGVDSVSIDGSDCAIDDASSSDTEFTCTTGPHKGTKETKVEVFVTGKGLAQSTNANFYYVDRWSSTFTWGGVHVPQDDEFVIIEQGQTILLDTKTAKLKMLLIKGGNLIFEDKLDEVHLQADNILIIDNGLLQIGTEDNPYDGQARITMHGHLRSPELPIYGAKTLGVREGSLEMHGRHIDNTWALLDKTADIGATKITLQIPVTWRSGDKIVIASTGLRHKQVENEKHEIVGTETGADGKSVITLKDPLQYQHLGITESYELEDGTTVTSEYRAEVGLLTRNIVFEGSNDLSWHDSIERCPDGFNTGQFATQTCFQGRFGEEEGSDEYGASIMIHSEDPSSGLATAHIEYVELTYVGQAYRLGRYPIHWHLMGDMNGNYVKGCALHKTFNRAVTIHGTHNLLVERNVLYDIMGGAFFIEDGIETGNIIQYNLAVFVRQSTSLLNDDITPAAYWVTNPDNIIRHNHAAGGTHFGFWYRMHEHPDGPSFDADVCQQRVELGEFRNNTAHTQGWFALWIFQTYTPMEGGGCGSNTPKAAKFYSLTAWHCEKGAEWVEGGAIQFHDFMLSSNEDSGIDIKLIFGTDWEKGDKGALIKNTVIIGHANFHEGESWVYESKTGIVLPFAPGLWMEGITFINIDQTSHAAFGVTHISGTCVTLCGGFNYKVERMSFTKTPVRIIWRWEHEGVIEDLDGTFTGRTGGASVVPYSTIYEDDSCVKSAHLMFGFDVGFEPMICESSVRFIRLAFNNIAPTSLEYKDSVFSNRHGSTKVPWLFKRLTHKMGWMVQLRSGETYQWTFENGEQFTNISYSSKYYGFKDGDYVIMKQQLHLKPDRISLTSGDDSHVVGETQVVTKDSPNLAWHYDDASKLFSFKVGPDSSSRKKRANLGLVSDVYHNYAVTPNMYRCLYTDCVFPVNVGNLPEVRSLPEESTVVTDFETTSDCFNVTGSTENDRVVTIPEDCWVVWAIPNGVVQKLHVKGNLFFDQDIGDIELTATYIIVDGRFIAGWDATDPHTNSLHIKLRGEHSTDRLSASNGVTIGSKAIACHGTCDLHGAKKGASWTRLAQTALADSNQLILQSSVGWSEGDEIVIAPSGFNAHETEKNVITHISSDLRTLTLRDKTKYDHSGITYDFGTGWQNVDMSAEVGVLTKNIKIEGEDYSKMQEESYGARVLVTTVHEYNAIGRFSNVEFYHSGQEGFYDSWDPRHSLAFFSSGMGSEVLNCSFHDGFSTAIGTYATNKANITGNVVHHTVNEGIVIKGSANILVDNLVVLNLFRGSYQDRYEKANFDYTGAINLESSLYTTLRNNAVAGAERVAYKVDGQPCDDNLTVLWTGNVAHAVLVGIFQLKTSVGGCSLINGFTVYKAWDYAIYQQTVDSVRVKNCAIVDSTVGYLYIIVGPAALTHEGENKSALVTESLFVGRSNEDDCSPGMDEENDKSLLIRTIAGVNKKAPTTPSGGRTGIMLGTFESAFNGALFKALNMNLNYPALYGSLVVTDVTVRNYGTVCGSIVDRIFYTNPRNEDAFHPTYIRGLIKTNVDEKSYVFIDRPDSSKINPSDCVDMQCDAKIKVLIKDMDGSFLGQQGSIFSQSEHGWGSQSLGLGDFRIPKPMLANEDGNAIGASTIVPNKGIARNDACKLTRDWQAYQCSGADAMDYSMLVIESLDADTETRRLSPVAIKYDTYVDLINGPQDHGWCAGYTCQKRISTFYSIVPVNQHIELYFTGVPPQHLRLHLLNAGSEDKITVAIWYPSPQKIDVRDGNGDYVKPNNVDSEDNFLKASASNPDEFKPVVGTANSGDNYLDLDNRFLYVCVGGVEGGGENAVVTIETQPTVIVTFGFPPVSVDDFFEEKLVSSLAVLLGIDEANIRRVQIVSESSARRRRSTTGDATFAIEIEAPTAEEVNEAVDKVLKNFQEGELSVDGVAATSLTATRAMTTESVKQMDADLAESGHVDNVKDIKIPAKISLATQPAGNEQSTLTTPPQVHILDENNELVTTTASTFTVTVSLDKTHENAEAAAEMSGSKTLPFTNGVADFNDLQISHSGTYKLLFTPSGSDSLSPVTSEEFALDARPVGARVARLQESGLVTEGDDLKFELQLTDGSSNDLQDVAFKGYTYKIDVSFDEASMYGDAALTGPTTFDFDSNGELSMAGLSLTGTTNYLVYNLKFRLYTVPASTYDLDVGIEAIQIYPTNSADYTHVDASNQKDIALRSTEDYDTVIRRADKTTVGTDLDKTTVETGFCNELKPRYPNVYIAPFTAIKTADGKLQFNTIVTAKSQSYVTDFVDNMKEDGTLRFGRTTLNLDVSCGITVDGVCDGDDTGTDTGTSTITVALNATSTVVPVTDDDESNITIIIFAVLGVCIFVSLCILVATYLVKRHKGSKIAAARCMDASPMSQRPLNGSLHSFQPDLWERGSPDTLEPGRMTPITEP